MKTLNNPFDFFAGEVLSAREMNVLFGGHADGVIVIPPEAEDRL